jgi:hypothetical protein
MASSISLAKLSRRLVVPATARRLLTSTDPTTTTTTTTRTMSTLPGRVASSTSLMTNRPRFLPITHHKPSSLHQEQRRDYLFLPVSWPEFKERFQRWVESPKNRTITVKLLLQDTQEAISKVSQRIKSQRIKAGKRRVIRRKQRAIKWKNRRLPRTFRQRPYRWLVQGRALVL